VNILEDHYIIENIDECIYSLNIQLSYTPPVALPTPFPKTFHVEGISVLSLINLISINQFTRLHLGFQLYLACASFVKHTMNVNYSDLNITKMIVNTPKGLSATRTRQSWMLYEKTKDE
jgi:hypothetical protein